MAPACGGDALGGESETGGAAEVCPLALSCDQTPTKMRLKAKSITLLIRISKQLWLVDRGGKAIRTHMVVKAVQSGFRSRDYGSQSVTGPPRTKAGAVKSKRNLTLGP